MKILKTKETMIRENHIAIEFCKFLDAIEKKYPDITGAEINTILLKEIISNNEFTLLQEGKAYDEDKK